jgi:hypothetical protein
MKVLNIKYGVLFLTFVGLIFISSCDSPLQKDKGEYIRWAEKNNGALRKQKEIKQVCYSLQLVTCEYQILKNARMNHCLRDSTISKQIDACKNEDYQYSFVLVISPVDKKTDLILSNAKSEQEALEIRDYMQFEIGADLKMCTDIGDIPCAMVYYEDMYGLSPNHTFNIVFDSPKAINNKLKISFYDRMFGGGLMNFSFDMETIKKTTLVI